jgi:hypothetical protein
VRGYDGAFYSFCGSRTRCCRRVGTMGEPVERSASEVFGAEHLGPFGKTAPIRRCKAIRQKGGSQAALTEGPILS